MGNGRSPYDYQIRLAGGDKGTECRSQLIDIPTGLGKTAAVVLAWLWNRLHPTLNPQQSTTNAPQWPRRLIYCLPMRTLVEQTRDNVAGWIGKLAQAYPENSDLESLARHSPVILMGGEENETAKADWDIYPERPAILIGTQDMLLSRALNRGYGMSRYRWPMHFGLLNNGCLWVMDETQLMGVGVETSAELDGFRHGGKMPTFGPCPTWWMSATLDSGRLATVDHPKPDAGWPTEKLSDAEQSSGQPHKLITAQKKLSPASFVLSSTTKGSYANQLAGLIKERHQPDTLTLVVLNRVARAREVFQTLTGGKNPLCPLEKVALIHSRFRPVDRERHTKLLFGAGDRIVIATQAVEAGVDVSARLLITELAPWSSLVQRLGRCNRRAEINDAQVLWVDIQPKDEKDELLLPYTKDDLEKARATVGKLADASPRSLGSVDRKDVMEAPIIRPVIRRRDLVDLFDTTPDICGQDLDVSRYIRDGDDNDVQFFWRSIEGDMLDEQEPEPERRELCRVSIADAHDFFKKKTSSNRVWRWNSLDEEWEIAAKPRPGAIYLADVASGGYNDDQGWTGDPKDKPTPCPAKAADKKESYRKDPDSFSRAWQTLCAHTKLVLEATDTLASSLVADDNYKAALHTAALWHDVGKAHAEFQKALRDGPHQPHEAEALYAKSKNPPKHYRRSSKPYRSVRHELASALAWLLKAPADAVERDLIAYLIAAHHGKVRLSIRSLPNEQGDPADSEALVARGVWHGDKLPPIPGIIPEPTILDLSFMKMGEGPHGPSWLARAVGLRDRLGPFRLAYLEAILRAADARASQTVVMTTAPAVGGHTATQAGYPPPEAAANSALREDALAGDPAYLMSHQSLDDLALLYFRAIADKIRRDPSLLRIPLENIKRWREQGSISPGSEPGIQVWEKLIAQGDIKALLALMIDPGEEGTRWRQYPVFVGILTPEESAAIRTQHETNALAQST